MSALNLDEGWYISTLMADRQTLKHIKYKLIHSLRVNNIQLEKLISIEKGKELSLVYTSLLNKESSMKYGKVLLLNS